MKNIVDIYKEACSAFGIEPQSDFLDILKLSVESQQSVVEVELKGSDSCRFTARIGDRDCAAICEALEGVNGLTSLSLAVNNISDISSSPLCRLLRTTPTLSSLDLRANDFTHVAVKALMETQRECGEKGYGLSRLNLSQNDLGEEGGLLIAEQIKVDQILVDLSLDSCGLGTKALVGIATALSENTMMSRLDLSSPASYHSTDDVAIHVAKAITYHPSVTHLALRKHRISDYGARAISDAFTHGCRLESLDLSCNKLTQPALMLLSIGITKSRLVSLNLSSNCMKDEGASHLAAAIYKSSISDLDIRSCGITDAGLIEIAASLLTVPLKRVMLWGNSITKVACPSLRDVSCMATVDKMDVIVVASDNGLAAALDSQVL